MRRVVWTDQALADLEAISLYLADFSPRTAARFFLRLKAAGDGLAAFAEKGRPAIHGTRELTTEKPYLIRYMVAGDRVYIIRIRHAARRREP